MNSLGPGVEAYRVSPADGVDWDEVVRLYGERFRGAVLCRHMGTKEYYGSEVRIGEAWVIAAKDVVNVERTLAECLLEEIEALPYAQNSSLAQLSGSHMMRVAHYLDVCDKDLLYRRGVIVVNFDKEENLRTIGQVWDALDVEEKKVVQMFLLDWVKAAE